MVNEPCGIPFDCRNVICIPTERSSPFRTSALHALAVGEGRLLPVRWPLDEAADEDRPEASVHGLAYGSACCGHCCDSALARARNATPRCTGPDCHSCCAGKGSCCYSWEALRGWHNRLPAEEKQRFVPAPSRALFVEWMTATGKLKAGQRLHPKYEMKMRNDGALFHTRSLEHASRFDACDV